MYTACLPPRLAGLVGFCPQRVRHQPLIRDQLETERATEAQKKKDKKQKTKKAQCMSKCQNKGRHLPSNRDPHIWNVSVCDMAYGNQCVLLCIMQKHFFF